MSENTSVRAATRFDWFYTLLCCWFVGGAFLDGWAHNHIPELESFFTPWHAVLYTGYAALAGFLALRVFMNHRKGLSWRESVPPGYDISILGALLFFFGGGGDMTWHIIFGVEQGVEALLSPTHLLLAIGGVLMVHGPFHSGRVRAKLDPNAKVERLPMLLSLTFTYALIAFMTQFASPLKMNVSGPAPVAAMREPVESLGVSAILLQTIFMMQTLLLGIKRWKMPFGGITLILMFSTYAMAFMSDRYFLVVPAAVAGLIGDLLYDRLKPSVDNIRSMHVFAFIVPVAYYALYFLAFRLHEGPIWWSIHMWTGVCVLAGITGLLLGYLISPHWQPKKTIASSPEA